MTPPSRTGRRHSGAKPTGAGSFACWWRWGSICGRCRSSPGRGFLRWSLPSPPRSTRPARCSYAASAGGRESGGGWLEVCKHLGLHITGNKPTGLLWYMTKPSASHRLCHHASAALFCFVWIAERFLKTPFSHFSPAKWLATVRRWETENIPMTQPTPTQCEHAKEGEVIGRSYRNHGKFLRCTRSYSGHSEQLQTFFVFLVQNNKKLKKKKASVTVSKTLESNLTISHFFMCRNRVITVTKQKTQMIQCREENLLVW